MNDITTRADIELLINTFYDRVTKDALLAPIFSHVDLPAHMPTMYNFWASLLLGERTYQSNPFQKHINLPIDPTHFNQWLHLFNTTVDNHFKGAVADEAKSRAQSIAVLFQHKLNLLK